MNAHEKKVLFWTAAVVLGHAAGSLGLYEKTVWFDNAVHFLGGIWLVLTLILFKNRFSFLDFLDLPEKRILKTVFAVIAFGVVWEVFEFAVNWYSGFAYGFELDLQPSLPDTFADLFLGAAGAWTSAVKTFGFRRPR